MAYVSQERKKKIAPLVKKVCEKYGVKGSLSIRCNSTLVLKIKSGKIDFIESSKLAVELAERNLGIRVAPITSNNVNINPYWYVHQFVGEAQAFMTDMFVALKSDGWFDKSDMQTDYFHTAYYIDVNVGDWDKPYELVK